MSVRIGVCSIVFNRFDPASCSVVDSSQHVYRRYFPLLYGQVQVFQNLIIGTVESSVGIVACHDRHDTYGVGLANQLFHAFLVIFRGLVGLSAIVPFIAERQPVEHVASAIPQ